jgi:hypothetical protein
VRRTEGENNATTQWISLNLIAAVVEQASSRIHQIRSVSGDKPVIMCYKVME